MAGEQSTAAAGAPADPKTPPARSKRETGSPFYMLEGHEPARSAVKFICAASPTKNFARHRLRLATGYALRGATSQKSPT